MHINNFFGLFVFIGIIASTTYASAACYESKAGEYCLTNKKYDCPAGCYCEAASSPDGALDKKGNGKTEIYKDDVISWCSSGKGCPWQAGSGQCGTSDNAKVYRCPEGFTSGTKATAKSSCYFKSSSGDAIYYTARNCAAGTFLPAKSGSCKSCTTGANDYCPGLKDVYPSTTKDQGVSTCPAGQKPNSSRTECETPKVEQPKTETTQSQEPAGPTTVQPGYYLPKGTGSKPKPCTETTYYCPGGDFVESDVDQGKIKCPKGSSANSKKDACSMKITMEQMKCGPKGNATPEEYQCWLHTGDAAKYKNCVFTNPYYN